MRVYRMTVYRMTVYSYDVIHMAFAKNPVLLKNL